MAKGRARYLARCYDLWTKVSSTSLEMAALIPIHNLYMYDLQARRADTQSPRPLEIHPGPFFPALTVHVHLRFLIVCQNCQGDHMQQGSIFKRDEASKLSDVNFLDFDLKRRGLEGSMSCYSERSGSPCCIRSAVSGPSALVSNRKNVLL